MVALQNEEKRHAQICFLLAITGPLACMPADDARDEEVAVEAASAEQSLQGANYSTDADKIAHGERLAEVLGCNTCHSADYTGAVSSRLAVRQ